MPGAYNVLFLPEFLFNRLQTFAQCSLCFGEVCCDFSKSYVMFFMILFRIFWITMWLNGGTMMYMLGEAHESRPVNIEAQTGLHTVHLIN